jgi:DNA primase
MSVKVVDMGASKDPDDYLKEHSADAFKLLIERSENHIEYRLMTIKSRYDLSADEGRLSYLAEATEFLAELESEPEREVYGSRVARDTSISAESVKSEIDRKRKIKKARQKKDFEKRVTRPASAMQPLDRELKYSSEGSAAAEEGIVRCLVRDPVLMKTVMEMGLSQEEFTSPFLAKVFGALAKRISEGRDTREALLLSELESSEASHLTVILQKPEHLPNSERTVREYIGRIRAEKFKTGDPDKDMLLEIRKYKSEKPPP